MAAIQRRPVTDTAQGEGVYAAARKGLPSRVAVAHRSIAAQTQTFLAERANATVRSLTSSHAVGGSRPPGDVARLINESAQATA
ncbi:hypothetical protein ACGF3J_22385 [Streptomyces sp. NPDC048171]|uniref:hypothetical protein n=1 Tax=unclassified Streptomyces TaxID=2593676 RepID=UPI001F4283A7|nr:hypothetical protein [Streptomyces sp. SID5789]